MARQAGDGKAGDQRSERIAEQAAEDAEHGEFAGDRAPDLAGRGADRAQNEVPPPARERQTDRAALVRMTRVLLAVLSAVLYGTGVAFEHRKTADTPASVAGRSPMWHAMA